MLIGEARLKISLRPANLPVKTRWIKAFVYQRVYTPRVVGRLRVYWRKRSAAVPKLPIVKMLIQCVLTLGNRTKESVYQQHPIWGWRVTPNPMP
jgi:hypothetical protein